MYSEVGTVSDNLSKFWQLDGNVTTIIPSNSDMNSYITPGNYRCVSNASLATLSNCPVDNAFSLKVSTPIGSQNYIVQEYIDLAGRQAIRAYSAYEKTWTEKKSVVKDDLPKYKDIPIDLSTLTFSTNIGGYVCNTKIADLIGTTFTTVLSATIVRWSNLASDTSVMLDGSGSHLTIRQDTDSEKGNITVRFLYV